MLRLFTKSETGTLTVTPLPGLAAVPETGWRWLDVQEATTEELIALGRHFGLFPVTIEDLIEPTRYPKLDEHEQYLFVVLHGVALADHRVTTNELNAVLAGDVLITAHREDLPALEWLIGQASESPVMAEGGPDRMLARVAEAVTRRYLPLVEELEERVDAIEEGAIVARPGVVEEILVLRRDAVAVRKMLAPQRDVAVALERSTSALLSTEAQRRFGDVFDHATRAVETLDTARMLLGSALDTHRSTVAERTNEAMQTLTVFAAIMLPLSLIAGIYGMNFVEMPELQWRWAYFGVLGLMLLLAFSLWVHFARRGLIGRPRLHRIPGTVARGLGRGVREVAELGIAPIRMVVEGVMRQPNAARHDDSKTYNGPRQGGSE